MGFHRAMKEKMSCLVSTATVIPVLGSSTGSALRCICLKRSKHLGSLSVVCTTYGSSIMYGLKSIFLWEKVSQMSATSLYFLSVEYMSELKCHHSSTFDVGGALAQSLSPVNS